MGEKAYTGGVAGDAPMDRIVLHLDMDAFYASVERRDRPELAGRPVVVGADPKGGKGRGVVAAASYKAREFGVHSAMPISRAYHLLPDDAVYLHPRIADYAEVSDAIFDRVAEAVDLFEAAGIDEAYADVTARCKGDWTSAERLARRVQDHVRRDFDLTCSVGIGPNKLVAKVASDLDKPDGLTVVRPGEVDQVLGPLPAGVIPGVGPKTSARLRDEYGVETVADLASLDPDAMEDRFGAWGPGMVHRARGVDDRPVDPTWDRKSVGTETTYGEDLDPADVPGALDAVVDEAVERLHRTGFQGRTVTLKVRLASFDTFTRARTVPEPVDDPQAVRRLARELLAEASPLPEPVRLLGLRVSGLRKEGPRQTTLDEWVSI